MLVVERKCVTLFIAQVVEQGTQMTPVGELVTTTSHIGRLSMLAKVNETGVQVGFFFSAFACTTHSLSALYLWLITSANGAFKGDSGPGRTCTRVHSGRVPEHGKGGS